MINLNCKCANEYLGRSQIVTITQQKNKCQQENIYGRRCYETTIKIRMNRSGNKDLAKAYRFRVNRDTG